MVAKKAAPSKPPAPTPKGRVNEFPVLPDVGGHVRVQHLVCLALSEPIHMAEDVAAFVKEHVCGEAQ